MNTLASSKVPLGTVTEPFSTELEVNTMRCTGVVTTASKWPLTGADAYTGPYPAELPRPSAPDGTAGRAHVPSQNRTPPPPLATQSLISAPGCTSSCEQAPSHIPPPV
jgi:hypothetical protein